MLNCTNSHCQPKWFRKVFALLSAHFRCVGVCFRLCFRCAWKQEESYFDTHSDVYRLSPHMNVSKSVVVIVRWFFSHITQFTLSTCSHTPARPFSSAAQNLLLLVYFSLGKKTLCTSFTLSKLHSASIRYVHSYILCAEERPANERGRGGKAGGSFIETSEIHIT